MAVFEDVLSRPPAERSGHLARICHSDPALRREVEVLLQADADAGSFGGVPLDLMVTDDETSGSSVVGSTLGPYVIEASIGRGGMGEVFRARDGRLNRLVAIKVMHSRFGRGIVDEARVVAALNHPHICTLYDVADDYLVMEYLEGETLRRRLAHGPLPIQQAAAWGVEIASALAAAHAAGIIHRDLKPANIMITPGGVKVLDFGLAKRVAAAEADDLTGTARLDSVAPGAIVGTPAYLSPEQAEGRPLDARSDVWSMGIVLYEMVSGVRPFGGERDAGTLSSILRDTPIRPRNRRADVPEPLERIILTCLAKDPATRYASASALERDLRALLAPASNRRSIAIAAAVLVVGLAVGAVGLTSYRAAANARWAESEAPAAIEKLITSERRMEALTLYRQALQYAPTSPALLAIGLRATPVPITTNPAGALVLASDYVGDGSGGDAWVALGSSPMTTDRLARGGYYRIRVEKPGYQTVEWAIAGSGEVDITLHPAASAPAGMVWVPAARAGQVLIGGNRFVLPVPLEGYWLDRSEVTNREYKAFVDAGGYRLREYWREPFVSSGITLDWADAIARFVDATGRPGPAGWRLGDYPEGAADLPVTGISWYEASAFAAFARKQLPSAYHWFRSSGAGFYSNILTFSNFSGKGPAAVGTHRGIGEFGNYDLAGNVKEWVANPARDSSGARFVLGGSWAENPYTFIYPDASDAWTRSETIGFRCARPESESDSALLAPIASFGGERRRDAPVTDEVFAAFTRLHDYDKRDLRPVIEAVDESIPRLRRETVSYAAAYGTGRALSHLFLPRGVEPPYQLVVVVPSANMIRVRQIGALYDRFDFLAHGGRAVLLPVLDHTLERGTGGPPPPGRNAERDRLLTWSKDLRRAIDYAEQRPDIDATRIAYYGISMGAVLAPTFLAVDSRYDTAIMMSGGTGGNLAPEVDPWNYAPRVTIPLLMLNGRNDFIYPIETRQLPLFEALGTAPAHKSHMVYDGGHVNLMIRVDVIRQILSWLDDRLGPPRAGRRP
jgi:dienelactone hydrolase